MISVLLSSTCFLSEADRILSSSAAVFVASSAQETEKDISPAERERVRKLIHRLHVSGGHVSKTSLRLLLQRRGCPVWMQQVIRVSNPVTPKMHNKSRRPRLQNCGRR